MPSVQTRGGMCQGAVSRLMVVLACVARGEESLPRAMSCHGRFDGRCGNRTVHSGAQSGMTTEHLAGIHRPERSAHARSWWKFLLAGPIIIVAVIVGSGVGIDAWFVGFAAVIFAVLLIAVGLVLGLARLVSDRQSVVRA